MTQAALAGIGFFVITLLAGEIAGRLAREELDGARQPRAGAPAGAAQPAGASRR